MSCINDCVITQQEALLEEVEGAKEQAEEDTQMVAATKADRDDNGIVVASSLERPDGYIRSPILHHDENGIAIPDYAEAPTMPPTQGPSAFYFPEQDKYREPEIMHKKKAEQDSAEVGPDFSLILFLALVCPYILRAMQALVPGTVFDMCCDIEKGAMAPRADSAEKATEVGSAYWVSMNQISEGEYNGRLGWRKARNDLQMRSSIAFALSLLRFSFWHLMQPISYFLVVRHYAELLPMPVLILAHIAGIREFFYLLLIVWCSLFKAAFLLVNLHVENDTNARAMQKIMYVFAPEKFLSMIALRGGHIGLIRCIMFIVIPLCDFCSVLVLLSELQHASLPLALLVSCTITTIGTIGMLVRVCMRDERQQQRSNPRPLA
jgi:hypothetical protein